MNARGKAGHTIFANGPSCVMDSKIEGESSPHAANIIEGTGHTRRERTIIIMRLLVTFYSRRLSTEQFVSRDSDHPIP